MTDIKMVCAAWTSGTCPPQHDQGIRTNKCYYKVLLLARLETDELLEENNGQETKDSVYGLHLIIHVLLRNLLSGQWSEVEIKRFGYQTIIE